LGRRGTGRKKQDVVAAPRGRPGAGDGTQIAMFRKLLFVNLSSVLFFSKFLILIVYDLVNNASLESLAVYSLVVGLTSSIFNVAMLWGRVYVLNEIASAAGILRFNLVLVAANATGMLITYAAFNSFAYFELIMAVAAIKFTENVFFGNISYIQKKVGRTFAFTLINVRSVVVIIVFMLFFLSGDLERILWLELAVGVLSCVYLYVLVGRICLRETRKRGLAWEDGPTFGSILSGVAWLSICAGLNALLNTVSLAYLMNNGMEMDAKVLALIFSAFAIITRLLFNNTFFFRHEMKRSSAPLTRASLLINFAAVAVFLVSSLLTGRSYDGTLDSRSLLIFAVPLAALMAVHAISVLLRQRLLLVRKVAFLVKMHAAELLVLGGILLIGQPGFLQLVLWYFLLRASRTYLMATRI